MHRHTRKQLTAVAVAVALTMTIQEVFEPTATELWLAAALCTVFVLECYRPRSDRL